ncbi:MAG TPA: DUF349 domain-containing protein [Mycobacteriales bacterium]|nr:DUF349 domain-containing protein [Mycobacteriales bacterium]
MTDSREWGRVAEDGTVYVRQPDGSERVIGSWQAGSVDEAFAYYGRRYDDLAAEVGILEARISTTSADPKAVAAAARKLLETLPGASAIGDLAALSSRLESVLAKVDQRLAEQSEARTRAAAAAADRKRELVAQAQSLAESNDWRATGERFRAIVEQWKSIRGVDRKTDSELWEQLATARKEFDRRRRAHFTELDRQREEAAERKQRLVTEAEKLAGSEDWAATARRFKELMSEWKAAGRASRETDDELWGKFKAAQDEFFSRRSEVLSARDAEFAGNLQVKEALLVEAEALDPSSDLEGARRRLRVIHEKWEKAGKVPRDSVDRLEQRLAAVEQRVRDAGSAARPVTTTESPLVVRLRESVTKLEARLERARAANDAKVAAETEQALATQRQWLTQAESSR